MRDWESVCDPALGFTSQVLIDALAVWREQAGSKLVPARNRLTARVMKPFLSHVAVFELVSEAPSRYRVRLMGTLLAQVLGEMQSKIIDDVLPHRAAGRWNAALDSTLAEARPLRFLSRVAFRNLDFLVAEVLTAPLLSEDGRAGMVLAVATFRSGVAGDRALDEALGVIV